MPRPLPSISGRGAGLSSSDIFSTAIWWRKGGRQENVPLVSSLHCQTRQAEVRPHTHNQLGKYFSNVKCPGAAEATRFSPQRDADQKRRLPAAPPDLPETRWLPRNPLGLYGCSLARARRRRRPEAEADGAVAGPMEGLSTETGKGPAAQRVGDEVRKRRLQ